MTKLFRISRNLRKILWNTKLKIIRKFLWNYKNQHFCSHPTPTQSAFCYSTHPPLPSAKTFFIAARQCYFEMKMIKQTYFSILSSFILCLNPSLSQSDQGWNDILYSYVWFLGRIYVNNSRTSNTRAVVSTPNVTGSVFELRLRIILGKWILQGGVVCMLRDLDKSC